MLRGPALGVVFIACVYVTGFIYKVSFFGSITIETSWLRMVEVDYLYSGVYAIFETGVMFGVHFIMLLMVYTVTLTYTGEVFAYSQKNLGYLLAGKVEKNITKFFCFVFVAFFYYAITFVMISFSLKMGGRVISLGETEAYDFLLSERQDRICNHEEKECYDGKLLYTNNTSYVFFVEDVSGDITKGKVKVSEQRHADVDVGWHERSIERYRSFTE